MANYTNLVCVLPCYMEVKTGLQQLLFCKGYSATIGLWSAGYVALSQRIEVHHQYSLKKLKIPDIRTLLRSRRLRWYGHVRRSSMCIKDVLELSLPGGRSRGRPAKTWLSCVEKDKKFYDLENADPLYRAEWRKCISRLLYTPATGTPTAV